MGPATSLTSPTDGVRLRHSMSAMSDWDTGPKFDTRVPRTVSVARGDTAVLYCKVFNLGNKTVSWLRQDSLHILSAGRYTYTSDQRYEAKHRQDIDTWALTIKKVRTADMGVFECQVSSQPVMSYFIHLRVVGESCPTLEHAKDFIIIFW